MDGFDILHRFHPKEISIMNRDGPEDELLTEHYRVDESLSTLPKYAKYIHYVTNRVHGLPFANEPNDKPYSEFLDLLQCVVDDAIATDTLIGYKGGNHERDILIRLGCENNMLNIEELDCPKFESIYRDFFNVVNQYRSCSRHASVRNKKMCSRVKILAYNLWLKKKSH